MRNYYFAAFAIMRQLSPNFLVLNEIREFSAEFDDSDIEFENIPVIFRVFCRLLVNFQLCFFTPFRPRQEAIGSPTPFAHDLAND